MRVKKCFPIFAGFIFLAILTVTPVQVCSSPSPVIVSVKMPDSYIPEKSVGTKFWVDFMIDASELTENGPDGIVSWTLSVEVNPAVLKPFMVRTSRVGYFLYDFAAGYGYPPPVYNYSIDDGRVEVTESLYSFAGGAATDPFEMPAPYLLVSVAYEAVGSGSTLIDIIDPMYRAAMDPETQIPIADVDGWYGEPPAPDLRIEGILLPYFPPVLYIYPTPMPEFGYQINATVTNQGTADAGSFNVSFSAYWEEEEVPELWQKKTIATLEQGATKTVWFYFMSENYGNYTLIIMADCDNDVAELDETNNVKTTWVIGTVHGDVDGNGKVDSDDFLIFGLAFGTKFKEPPYGPADFDYDGDVDSDDFLIFGLNYGKTV